MRIFPFLHFDADVVLFEMKCVPCQYCHHASARLSPEPSTLLNISNAYFHHLHCRRHDRNIRIRISCRMSVGVDGAGWLTTTSVWIYPNMMSAPFHFHRNTSGLVLIKQMDIERIEIWIRTFACVSLRQDQIYKGSLQIQQRSSKEGRTEYGWGMEASSRGVVSEHEMILRNLT